MYAASETGQILAARRQPFPSGCAVKAQLDAAKITVAITKRPQGQSFCFSQTGKLPGVQSDSFAMTAGA